jgi:integrase
MSEAAMIVTRRYRYVHQDMDRWGNVRTYFRRRAGERKVRIHEASGTTEFDRRYRELAKQAEAGTLKPEPSTAPEPGTFRWLGVKWISSAPFKQNDPRTQHVTRLVLEGMYQEPIAPGSSELFADWPVAHFGAKACRILRDRKAAMPEGANNRVRRLRALFKWATLPENEDLGVTANPARDVPFLKPKRAGGFPAWTSADIDKFEERHPVGTRAGLALALLCFTGVRRSDVVLLGRQHAREGRLAFRPHKGRNRGGVAIDIPILSALQRVIDVSPVGDLTFLVTERGQPFTAAGFGNWFRERCDEAGLKGLSAHGLRKAAAARAAENGATAHQLMAIFGWLTIAQAELYTRNAERKRLATAGMETLGTDRAPKIPTSDPHPGVVGKLEAKK